MDSAYTWCKACSCSTTILLLRALERSHPLRETIFRSTNCAKPSAKHAAWANDELAATFGALTMSVSDVPTHFETETLCLVSKEFYVPHHFTLSYIPWCNDGARKLGEELLRIFRVAFSMPGPDHGEWLNLFSFVQSVISYFSSP